jgi:hypothetical protein
MRLLICSILAIFVVWDNRSRRLSRWASQWEKFAEETAPRGRRPCKYVTDFLTDAGKSIAENVAGRPIVDPHVIRPVSSPISS